ncbi:MAG: hypothetical protein AAFW46_11205 [Pseudomonadota bacterium]
MPPDKIDVEKISSAPLELPESNSTSNDINLQQISELRSRLEELQGELERAKAQKTVSEEKAKLLQPFSWWVFGFVCVFCVVVFSVIIIEGAFEEFKVDSGVLSIMAGSTIVAVIGLISVILTGLYKDK